MSGTRFLLPAVLLLGLTAYLYSLDGLHIPHIGDEAPYIEIVRLTAESGDWLPLRTGPGLENTKPPFLYWLGIVSTHWGQAWSLFRLRLPILICTLLTAGLVFFVAAHVTSDRERAFFAGLTFLGFHSTFQYGRPFLTNLPETLFVFLAFTLLLVAGRHREGFILWIGIGLSLGVACLFKSFALIAPVGLALAWCCMTDRRWDVRAFARRDLPKLGLTAVVALGCFALWPILDPAPAEILRHFVLEENLGKLGGEGYVTGLFTGPYPLYRIWFGHLGNAGLFALPLVYLVVVNVRERKHASRDEKRLWILVLSFLIVYSFPGQRQENYLIPTVPALAVLMGLRWPSIGRGWFRIFNVPPILLMAGLLSLVWAVRAQALPAGSYATWHLAIPALTMAGWLGVTLYVRAASYSFHGLVFLTYLSLACAMAPFEGSAGRFDPEHVKRLEGRRVYVPEGFIRRHERHRFLLPGARIEGYDPLDTDELGRLLESGKFVVVHRALRDNGTGPFRVFARRLDLRSRQTPEEMWRIAFHHELDLLVHQELVVRRFRRDRMLR